MYKYVQKNLLGEIYKMLLSSLEDVIVWGFFSFLTFGIFFFYNEHVYLFNWEQHCILIANADGVLAMCRCCSTHLTSHNYFLTWVAALPPPPFR